MFFSALLKIYIYRYFVVIVVVVAVVVVVVVFRVIFFCVVVFNLYNPSFSSVHERDW